jgi:hypothetical protein
MADAAHAQATAAASARLATILCNISVPPILQIASQLTAGSA